MAPYRLSSLAVMTLIIFFANLFALSQAHTRLECPPPRSGETGAKEGPCDAPDDPENLPAYPLQPNALNTVTWVESISHPGAPARFALSYDGNDEGFEECLLLDHVPHDEYSLPTFTNEETYHRSSITLWIPDIYCDRCFLQLITFMTDDIHGVPDGQYCAYPSAKAADRANASLPDCPVVYHSCAPVSINGSIPRSEITKCDTNEFETQLEWPFSFFNTYSTYYFKGNPGIYNQTDSRLMSGGAPIEGCDNYAYCDPDVFYNPTVEVPADAKYASLEGSCAAIVASQVEPFVLGQLPSTPKNTSNVFVPPDAGPCTACVPVSQCFAEGCALRDLTTGNWSGPAAPCNEFGAPCEECYTESPCYLGGYDPEDGDVTADEGDEDENDETNSNANDIGFDETGNGASINSAGRVFFISS
jgi:hypothetical protein